MPSTGAAAWRRAPVLTTSPSQFAMTEPDGETASLLYDMPSEPPGKELAM
jgi:hypothetical protein